MANDDGAVRVSCMRRYRTIAAIGFRWIIRCSFALGAAFLLQRAVLAKLRHVQMSTWACFCSTSAAAKTPLMSRDRPSRLVANSPLNGRRFAAQFVRSLGVLGMLRDRTSSGDRKNPHAPEPQHAPAAATPGAIRSQRRSRPVPESRHTHPHGALKT